MASNRADPLRRVTVVLLHVAPQPASSLASNELLFNVAWTFKQADVNGIGKLAVALASPLTETTPH